MPIRITGMNSGLDTESIIAELVNVQKTKGESIKKTQTSLGWKQNSWKELNKKLMNFYNNTLDNMSYQYSYTKKKSTLSNSGVADILASANAVNGVQSFQVDKLAKSGYMTGAELKGSSKYTSNTALSELGITDASEMTVTVDGKDQKINLTPNMKISDLVSQLNSSGVNASFDANNQRFFISSKSTGVAADFEFSFSDTSAMFKLGLNTAMTETEMNDYLAKYQFSEADVEAQAAARAAQLVEANAKIDTIIAEQQGKMAQMETDGYDPLRTSEVINGEIKALEENESLTDEEKKEQKAILENELKKATEYEGYQKTIDDNMAIKDANSAFLDENGAANDALKTSVRAQLQGKLDYAQAIVDKYNNKELGAGTNIDGEDAVIRLNGAEFKSSTNVFDINGLTITAKQLTGSNVETITTQDDASGIYDMVKGLLKEYNTLINEMNKLYNAEPSKGYEPLTDAEKEAMSDTEVEKWEQKIKDSVLRRDSTLGTISDMMVSIMMKGTEVNGKQMYLSDFGIETLGYFNAGENEKNAYHIDGDKDDSYTKNEEDKLMAMITKDPDSVSSFFSGLSRTLKGEFQKAMGKTQFSSSFTFYEDIRMKEEYDNYTTKIKTQEDRLTALEDKWYKKFSAMETALAKMQSSSSAITGLLGG